MHDVAPELPGLSPPDELEALLQFLYLAPVGLIQITPDGEVVMMNPLAAQLLMPLSKDGGLANLFTTLEGIAPDLRSLAQAYGGAYGKICEGKQLLVSAGVRGKRDPQILSLTLLRLDGIRLMAVLDDISAQVKRERLLQQHEAWFNAILTGVSDYALVSLNSEGNIEAWNTSIGRVTGFDAEQVLNQPYSLFYPPEAMPPDLLLDRLQEADLNGWSLDDGWRMRADGSRFWGSAMIAPLQEQSGRDREAQAATNDAGYCLVIRDLSDKREANELYRRASACDHLTGLANRRSFFEAAELEVARRKRRSRPLSLILFDVDHFKSVNDKYGHPVGDAVLRSLAEVLQGGVRPVDVAARIGGEEFAVLLPSTPFSGAERVAERLRQAVEASSVESDGVTVRYTVSGGVATMSDTMDGIEALIKAADRALYAAKSAGRNRIVPAIEPDAPHGSPTEVPARAVGPGSGR